jgi:hypothetical protein
VFENRILRDIFGLEEEEVTGDGKKLNNEEFQDSYTTPNITPMVESGSGQTGHVIQMREKKCTWFWWGNLRE